MTVSGKIKQGLGPFLEKPVLANLLFGMAESFPLSLVLGVLPYWLSEVGVDKTTIGIFAIVSAPYAYKFFWSPALDRVSLGPITRIFGRRRGWLFTIQILMILAIWGLASTDPSVDPVKTGLFALFVTTLSASQDTIIDAYRIEIMKKSQYAHGATALTFGYRAAGLITNAGLLFMAIHFSWNIVFVLSPILLLPGLIAALWVGEPEGEVTEYLAAEREAHKDDNETSRWFYEAVVLPFKEIMTRRGWWVLLLFIVSFKIGDAVVVIMTAPFVTDLGFVKSEIVWANKTVGGIALWVGVFFGSFVYAWFGVYRALLITIFLMMFTNVAFAWLAITDHSVYALAAVMGAENFASGIGNVTVVAFLSSLCNRSFTATQYALFSSLSSQGRTLVGMSSGYFAESFGWVDFFIGSALVCIPSIFLLLWIWKKRLIEVPDH